MDWEAIKKDLEILNSPTLNGRLNLTYADGYYAKSLERKYGIPISELEAIVEGRTSKISKYTKCPRQKTKSLKKKKEEKRMKQPTIQIPKFVEVSEEAAPLVADAEAALDWLGQMEITDNESLEHAVKMVAEVKKQNNSVSEKLAGFIGPLKSVIDDLNGFFNPAINALSQAETTIKDRISEYVKTSLTRRDEVLEGMSMDDNDETKATALARVQDLTPKKISGMSIRESWDGDVVDEDAIITWALSSDNHSFLTVDKKKLKAYTKAMEGKTNIPGWKPKKGNTVAITVSKVK
jgi:uncharacterized protein (DUF2384 family)